MLPHSPPHPTCRYRCRQVLIGSRISNPMYVLMCPVTAQYTGELGDALVVCSAAMSIVWPATSVVWARSAQDILAGTSAVGQRGPEAGALAATRGASRAMRS